MDGRARVGALMGIGLVLEGILGAAAIYAGISFITTPDGSGMQMPVSWLDKTPFADYFVPGLILVTVNGLLPLAVILLALTGSRLAALGMIASGVLLFGWLSIQLAMIQMIHPVMHPSLYAVSIVLVAIGYLTWRRVAQPSLRASHGV